MYFNNDLQTKQLAISEFPVLLLANRQKDLNAVIEYIWQGKDFKKGNPPDFYQEIFDVYNKNLLKAVSSDDPEMAKLLKNNVSRLAAAKTNYTIQLIYRCKADVNAVARNKEEFQKAAKVVINRANSTQAAEYNTVVHRSRVVKQWERFEKEKYLYPHFKWLRTRSATPREVHLAYVGRVWHLDDPFLKTNHPGCTWNCKCDGTNTDEPVTENSGIIPVPPSPGLEGNPYYTGEIFSNKHPYFSRVDKHIPELGVLHNPDEIVYLKSTDENGKIFLEHYNCRYDEEHTVNLKAIQILNKINFAKEIKLLPRIHASQVELRERYYGKAFQKLQPKDCPDAVADGKLIEFKSGTKKTASKRILQAAQKAEIVYLELTEKFSDGYLNEFINRQWNRPDRLNLSTIILNNNGIIEIFNRP